jgi:hypothetical protein
MPDNYSQALQDFINHTSAAHVQAGFEFQFYVFFFLLLKMGSEFKSIEYETDDDIVVIKGDDKKVLIQAKNAILNQSGNVVNLTNRDTDLWHTISNWMKQYEYSTDSDFFLEREFFIYTSKSIESNDFYKKMTDFKNEEITITILDSELDDLISNTIDNNILDGMNRLKSIDIDKRKQFYKRFEIKSVIDTSIIQKIVDILIYDKNLPENKIPQVYASLHSELIDDGFVKTCRRDKIKLTTDEIYKKLRRSFNRQFDRTLSIDRQVDNLLPGDLLNHTFINQLIDIDYIFPNDEDDIRKLHIKRIGSENKLLKSRLEDHDIDKTDLENIELNCLAKWDAVFGSSARNIRRKESNGMIANEEDLKNQGFACFEQINNYQLQLDTVQFDLEMTQGYFYTMSNEPRIGWRYDWERKYKKDDI